MWNSQFTQVAELVDAKFYLVDEIKVSQEFKLQPYMNLKSFTGSNPVLSTKILKKEVSMRSVKAHLQLRASSNLATQIGACEYQLG